ncbi:hypothetical protein OHC33_006757 [Knufia fluminis]|uniref:Rhodanese domain-containing protein n=1 Tax=Knufia fluminis TaxID=191047 RepID=A0AAN8ECH5_9EURO|nr:hypothetical protein OHC33_006757 [Knufia fluminis]
MPIDLTPLGTLVNQTKPVPGLAMQQIPYVNQTNLNTFLKKEIPKKPGDKAKVKFVDCQSTKENAGKQFTGAIHMNFDDFIKVAAPKFNVLIKGVPTVYNDLGTADVVVFYCYVGANRSPAMAGLYINATTNVATRPTSYNANQRVMVLNSGMTGYMVTPTPQGLSTWLTPTSGKIVAGCKGSGKVPQPGGDADDWDVIYTDP